ncbi:MAG: hypothetical protein FWD35_03865 [Oscillospiraceae bacterium]|nr:hypothetical protein [Oscillospiraceae bacterium]
MRKQENIFNLANIKKAAVILLLLCIVMSCMVVMRVNAKEEISPEGGLCPSVGRILTTTNATPVEYNTMGGVPDVSTDLNAVFNSMLVLSGFEQISQISADPAISVAVLSVVGLLQNSDGIDLGDSNFVNRAASLPTAGIVLAILTSLLALARIILPLFPPTDTAYIAFLKPVEKILGMVTLVLLSFDPIYGNTAESTELLVSLSSATSNDTIKIAVMTAIGFGSATISLGIFAIIQNFLKGIDAAIFLIFALILPLFPFVRLGQFGLIILYIALCIFLAPVAIVIGIAWLIIATLLFRYMKRLERYFKQIYVKPFMNSTYKWLFKKDPEFPIIIKKRLPKFVAETFPSMRICQEAFILKGIAPLPARERVYLVQDSAGETHICRRKWYYFGWEVKGLNMTALYGDPQFRFLMFYSMDDHSEAAYAQFVNKDGTTNYKKLFKKARVKIVLRRELNKSFDVLLMSMRYNEAPLNIARRQKADEKACKKAEKQLMAVDN